MTVLPTFPSVDFIKEVEELVAKNNMSYMDSILHWCEKKNIEIESVSTLIANNTFMKARLQLEAENLHFLPKSIKFSI